MRALKFPIIGWALVNPLSIQAWSKCKANQSINAKISSQEIGDKLVVTILPVIVGTGSTASFRIISSGFLDGEKKGCTVDKGGSVSETKEMHSFKAKAGEEIFLMGKREMNPTITTPNGVTISGGFKKAELVIIVDGRSHNITLPESPRLQFLPNTKAVVSCTFRGEGCKYIGKQFTENATFRYDTSRMTFPELNAKEIFLIGKTPNFKDECLNDDFSVWGRTSFVRGALRFEFASQKGLKKPEILNADTMKSIMLVPEDRGIEQRTSKPQNEHSYGEATCRITEVSVDHQ